MAKTFDDVVYSLCKKYTDQSQLGFKSVKQVANGFEIEYVNGTKAAYTVQDMHQHTNMAVLNVLNKDADGDLTFNGKKITNLTADQETLLMKFSLSADNKLLFDGKPIEGGGSGEPYDDTEVRGMINTNKTNISTNTSDISDLNTKIGTTAMGTTATTIKGAVKEINGNQLDTVSFSSDYKNIVLNRKNGLNPYSIPIAAIINHAKLIELGDVDTADIGNGKTLMYDAVTQKHKYVSSTGTDELVKMDNTSDAHYLVELLDKQTIVNDNGVLKAKKLDGQEVTIAEINYLKGLTMNVMDLVNAFANGGVKVINTPLNTASELSTMDRSTFIDGISYIVYVLADENHAGAKTTYLVDKTNTTFFGNADSQRDFVTNPIDLANEVTGKLGVSNIDVDNLWSLLTIDDTYKTLTTTNNIFGTHGAKTMYDELIANIGNKANKDSVNTHIGDTTIHITQDEKDSYALKTEVLAVNKVQTTTGTETHDNVYSAKLTKTELDKKANDSEVVKKTDITTTIDSSSTDDTIPTTKAIWDRYNVIDRTEAHTNIIIDALSVDVNSPYMPYNKDGIVLSNGVNTPTDLLWGIREVYWKSQGNVVVKINGMDTNNKTAVWIDTLYGDTTSYKWTGWRKLCTTSVADVPKTNITFTNSNVSIVDDNELGKYCVLNGICYVTLNGLKFSSGYVNGVDFAILPRPAFRQDFELTNSYGDISLGKLFLESHGGIHLYTRVTPIPDTGFISFSYPVAE